LATRFGSYEDHLDPVDTARYSTHRKCLPSWPRSWRQAPSSSQLREALSRIRGSSASYLIGGPRLRPTSACRPAPTACSPARRSRRSRGPPR
jgi:hypothetical protein